jgi:hypothetical protein
MHPHRYPITVAAAVVLLGALWTILIKEWRAKAVWGSRVIKQPELR